jgi:MFS family permease
MRTFDYPPLRLAWTIWGLGAVLYLIGFFQRVAPAVMTGELMVDFAIGAAGLGNLSAFYFYSYVAMQVPTGLLADRWGPRRLLTAGALLASVGTLIFALSPSFIWAGIGRLLIGGSVAVAFVCMLKLAGHWLPPRQYALASGLAMLFGIVGAVVAGVPLQMLIDAFGWRPVMLGSALVTLLVALPIWHVVRDDPVDRGYASHTETTRLADVATHVEAGVLAGIRKVLSYRNTWLLYFIPGGIVGTGLAFAGLWGVPYLSIHYELSASNAAVLCSILLIAMAVGGPVFGWLSDHLGHRKPLYVIGSAVVLVTWSLILMVPGLPVGVLIGLLVVTGFFSGSMIVGFAYAKESVPESLAGTVAGIINMGVMMGPLLLQPLVGWMLDRAGSDGMRDNVPVYTLEAYRSGFAHHARLVGTVIAAGAVYA